METLDDPDPNPNLDSPYKRQKTQTQTLAPEPPITPSLNKGKSPIIAAENEDDCVSPPENCGICMSSEGESFRGLIDSCDHYFCLLCIIQWSKIESRCPLCRGRFSTIRRVRKDGSSIGQGCVRVPVRDQIYDPFGEPVDPYAQAKCCVCNGTTDESLLLLCDLCDSASHTYCVGLGATVPEGDWYCRDCALLRAEPLDSETGDDGDQVDTSTNSEQVDEQPSTSTSASASVSVSIFDIVRDPSEKLDLGTNRLLKLVSHPTKFSSSAIISDPLDTASSRSVPGARGSVRSSMEVTESSARTLRNCRNVQRHINVLRENWDAVRTGYLSFSSAFSDSLGKASHKKNINGTSETKSGKSRLFSSTNSLPSKAVDSSYDTWRNKEPYNVDRAWKLMSIAKTKQRSEYSKSTHNEAHSGQRDKFIPNCGVPGRKNLIFPGLGKGTDLVNERQSQSPRMHQLTSVLLGRQHKESCLPKLSIPRAMQTDLKSNFYHNGECSTTSRNLQGRYSTTLRDGSSLSASSRGPIAEVSNSILERTVVPSRNNLGRGIFNMPDEKNGFSCSTSSNEPVGCASDADLVKLEGKKTSACTAKVVAKITSKSSKEDEVKAEILSLVKLNLKFLTKDKQLGVDAFKEIARLSTHTILGSCGFEHRKIVGSLPTLVCRHGDEILHLHRSAIVPSSCRECFYAFVKDVVNSIMSEKLNFASVAS